MDKNHTKQERVSFIGAKLRAKEPHLMKEQAKYHRQTDCNNYRREQSESRLQYTNDEYLVK